VPQITINDVTLAYQLENQDAEQAPLVFLHGATLTRETWAAQIAHFALHHPALAYDARNHGASSLTPGEHDLETHAEDLLALLEALGLEGKRRPVLIGLSMGGMIAMRAALRSADAARALVLVNTTSQGWYPPEERDDVRATLEHLAPESLTYWAGAWEKTFFTPAFREAHPERVSDWRHRFEAQSIEQYREAMLGLLERRDISEYLGIIDCPTLVLAAAQDVTIPPQLAEKLAKAIPDAELQMLPDCAHLCNEEQPAAFNAAVEGFLARVLQ
jgi:pimeloyl-ACP methyl ester carboxylesterase